MGSVNIVPCLTYRDAPAAIEWLSGAFGFEALLVVPNEDGGVAHAELRLGDGLIMLGSEREGDRHWRSPLNLPGLNQTVYVIVEDVAAAHGRAVAAGAVVTDRLTTKDYGGSGFGVLDLEGHCWSFGDYAPDMATQPQALQEAH